MNIINLTPHDLNIHCLTSRSVYHPDGKNWGDTEIKIEASGTIARIVTSTNEADQITLTLQDGDYHSIHIPVTRTNIREIVGLPYPANDTIYVTNTTVAQAAIDAGRTDVYAPGPLVHNDQREVVGYNGLSQPEKSAMAKTVEKLRSYRLDTSN